MPPWSGHLGLNEICKGAHGLEDLFADFRVAHLAPQGFFDAGDDAHHSERVEFRKGTHQGGVGGELIGAGPELKGVAEKVDGDV